jgi:hypothetical protein
VCTVRPTIYLLLVPARTFVGPAVSPVEYLPSGTIAEICFLHEVVYRLGMYTLLLLGGKHLISLAGAAIIQLLSRRRIFWIVAIVVTFSVVLLSFFIPGLF